jgi:hypothetical protein
MKHFIKQPLLKNFYTSAKTFKRSGTRPVSTLATIASLGLGLTYFLSNKTGLVGSVKKEKKKLDPFVPDEQSSTTENKYFEAAPRAISGSHRSYREYAGTGNSGMKKSSQFALGSAALLSIMYLMSKRK